jgi:hypothetical protein
MRRLRRNHQKQPTIDQLGAAPGAAPASRRRSALGVPHVTSSRQLRGQHVSYGLQHPPPGVGQLCGRCVSPARGSSGGSTRLPSQISSGGASCHRLRSAPGPAHVSWAPAPASRCRTAPGGAACPHSSGPEEKRRAE